jgi:hypothetical protein
MCKTPLVEHFEASHDQYDLQAVCSAGKHIRQCQHSCAASALVVDLMHTGTCMLLQFMVGRYQQ